MKHAIIVSCAVLSVANAASAGMCDYRPSNLIGKTGAVAAEVGATSTAMAGAAMKAIGLYSITNGTTGAAMLGWTGAGSSAAGTTGIIAGTSGAIGTIGGILLMPEVIIGAAAVAVVGGAVEGGCYLSD